MNRFIIEIIKDNSKIVDSENVYDTDSYYSMTKQDYNEFIEQAKNKNIFEDISKSISLACDYCRSFIIPAVVLYKVLISLDDDYGFYSDLEDILVESVLLNNEEWKTFMTEGIKDIDFVYSGNGDIVNDIEGNPYRYKYEECAFIMDAKCDCLSVMKGDKSIHLIR